jgi:GMP synthase-like glutamine amidotransferase
VLTVPTADLYTHRPDIRFTGICFGHQILCRALGARVEPNADNDWELSHTPVQLTPLGQSLFALPKSQNTIRLHQMHLDHVITAPSPSTTDLLAPGTRVHVWGSSDHTGVQGIYIAKRVFTTQGHMEFSEAMVKRQLEMRVKSGALGEGAANEATFKAEWEHDGKIVAKAVLRFFHGDDDAVE